MRLITDSLNLQKGRSDLIRNSLFYYTKAKSMSYALQYWALVQAASILPGQKATLLPNDPSLFEYLAHELNLFLKQDIQRIEQGHYPLSVLKPSSPLENLKKLPRLLLDIYSVGRRRKKGRTTEFNEEAK